MSCVGLVAKALEGLEEIEKVNYRRDQDVFDVKLLRDKVPREKIIKIVEETGRDHDQKLGLSGRPPWKVQFLD